jgi:hypothetical protein
VLVDTHIFNESTLGALMAETRDEGHLQTAEEPAIGRLGDDQDVSFVRDDLIECLEIGLRKRFERSSRSRPSSSSASRRTIVRISSRRAGRMCTSRSMFIMNAHWIHDRARTRG